MILIDLRGYGNSSNPHDFDSYTLKIRVDDTYWRSDITAPIIREFVKKRSNSLCFPIDVILKDGL